MWKITIFSVFSRYVHNSDFPIYTASFKCLTFLKSPLLFLGGGCVHLFYCILQSKISCLRHLQVCSDLWFSWAMPISLHTFLKPEIWAVPRLADWTPRETTQRPISPASSIQIRTWQIWSNSPICRSELEIRLIPPNAWSHTGRGRHRWVNHHTLYCFERGFLSWTFIWLMQTYSWFPEFLENDFDWPVVFYSMFPWGNKGWGLPSLSSCWCSPYIFP
jgi:hypothetical protein